MYLLFITTSLGVYYTPKLSGLKDKKSIRNEIFNGYIKIIPIVIVLALVIFTLKEYVILIAYSSEFIPMNELFLWQLIGDVIKISSYLISTIMIAKAMTFTYIFSEILFSVTYVLLSYYLISKYNLIGVTYAYALNYFLYLSFIVLRFRSLFYVK
jgi:PST family polysaccharide transporter